MQVKKGFTLIELIVVMAILAIIGTLVTISWPGTGMTLNAQAEQLANDIRYIQFVAMSLNKRTRINFSLTQYSLTELDGVTAINHPATGSNTINFPSGINLTTTGLAGSYVVFDTKGIPYVNSADPGTKLAVTATVTLTTSTDSRTIDITPETGMVSIP